MGVSLGRFGEVSLGAIGHAALADVKLLSRRFAAMQLLVHLGMYRNSRSMYK